MKLLVTGTSHLIPRNQAWKPLAADHELTFAEQNEWSDLFLREESRLREFEAVAWIIALEDILNAGSDGDDFRGTLEILLNPLRTALARMPKVKFVAAWSFPLGTSAIRYARSESHFWDEVAREFENSLRELQVAHESLYLLPLNRAFAGVGRNACFDARNFYAANCRFSFRGLQIISESVAAVLYRTQKPAAKVLVLDCDNTLWGGVIGEDGLDGIVLGQDGAGKAFQDFQRAAKRLAKDGTLVALASKNNEADVWQVFEKHPAMILKRDDIAAAAVNWSEKSAGIHAMAEELGLGLDSFVFWDDNPLEREMLRAALPQVFVPEVPRDVSEWGDFLENLVVFHRFAVTAEDRKKLTQYQARGKFQSELRGSSDQIAFLKSLQLRPEALDLDAALLGRAEQLCAKTNQFNLRTRRHSAADLKQLAEQPGSVVFLTHLQDRFGDHGNVALVAAVTDPSGKAAFLDTFLMSCRVLGRHLEAWMLQECAERLRRRGCKKLLAEFIPSERNDPAKKFLQEHGFEQIPGERRGEAGREFPQIQPASDLYEADLSRLKIPHVEIYDSKN